MKINLQTLFRRKSDRRRGFFEVDLVVALGILGLVILPLGYAYAREQHTLRAEYYRAAVDEIVDGEAEILAAGDWKQFPDGSQNYPVHSLAAADLPPGHFELIKSGNHLRLEWLSDQRQGIGSVVREITIK
jgi:hypothetical protein